MEKSNSTNLVIKKSISALFVFMVFALHQNVFAQCSLGVNSNTQISLDEQCEAEITPEIVLNDQTTTCPNGVFSVNVKTLDEVTIPSSPIVTGDYVNETLIAEVVDATSGNTGWGYIHIEDKLAPVITCLDVTVSCSDISNYEPTVIDACDPNPTYTLISQTEVTLDCDPDFIKEITRTYQAQDAEGNVSPLCTQVITVERIDIDAVVFPLDRSEALGTSLQCDETYPLDDQGNPSPSYTGVPTLDNESIYPTTDLGCNTVVTYNDVVLPSIGGVQKIMREWIVNEWYCSGSNMRTDIQIIEIVDDEGPVVTDCPDNFVVSTTAGTDCEAYLLLPALTATDACGTVAEIDVTYPGGFLNNQNGGLVSLPIGVNVITYTLYDNNQNSSQCSFEVTVEDNTAPVVVCDQNTVVSLAMDGTAIVNAFSFDDGSYDDCSPVEYYVKRMDNGVNCTFDNQFGPTVTFCCADLGEDVMVILRVVDANGNFNDCMVSVEVQDKLEPTINCPANETVDCDFAYDPENLAASFGTATGSDNCTFSIVENQASISINGCGEGTIVRSFSVLNELEEVTASCIQVITFVNNEPFVESDITWPSDVTINDCVDPETLHPDQTGYPIINEDACDMVGFDWDDKTFTVVNGDNACFKIIRTWEVNDWCQSNGGSFVNFTHQQVIKVINTDDPIFSGTYDDLVECTFDNECLDGFIDLSASAEDACTNELLWTYRIDLDNNGSFDIVSNTIIGESVDASGTYAIGNHRIVYTAEDGCGNSVSQTQLFSIVNCKAPTPYCINGLAIELMPIDTDNDGEADTGMIDIWASDFDAGSFHSCGLPVTVSFSADPLDTGRMYTCDELGDNTVQIWAHVVLPNGMILQDFCTANVDIQDNNGVCGTTTSNTLVVIEGDVENEMLEKADNVEVILQGSELIASTNEFGVYSFPEMLVGGAYEIIPTKTEEDKLNGITTLDIILLQKHILGLEILQTPYKIIAADVNKDGEITGIDIINLRKLILGVYAELPNNNDWRFVDTEYNFINPSNPLNEDFSETYIINELNADMDVDFVAIKVGDVNNTATANLSSTTSETRTSESFDLVSANKLFKSGDVVTMDITVEDAYDFFGLQFTMSFNNMALDYNRVESGLLDLDNNNIGLTNLDQGVITASWSKADLTSVEKETILFTVYFNALSDGQLSGNVAINSEITNSEAYDVSLEAMDINLDFRNDNGEHISSSPFALYQNIPNPFTQNTNITFNLPQTTSATLSVFDVSGKLIYTETNPFGKGMNSIQLNVADFDATGVLYYQIETKEYTATRKMVVLK